MFNFNCPHCDRRIRVPEAAGGKSGKCPGCQKIILVPAPVSSKPPELPDSIGSQISENSDSEYRLSPIQENEEDQATKSAAIASSSTPTRLPEMCEYCERRNTTRHNGRLWCASCNNWAHGREEKPSDSNADEGNPGAFSTKHLTAWGLGMLTTAVAGPVLGHAVYEANLKETEKPTPSTVINSPAQATENKAEPVICSCCKGEIDHISWTCPHCGHTQWLNIIVLGIAAVASMIWGWVGFDWANNADAKLPSRIAMGFGLIALAITIVQIVISMRSENLRVTRRQASALVKTERAAKLKSRDQSNE